MEKQNETVTAAPDAQPNTPLENSKETLASAYRAFVKKPSTTNRATLLAAIDPYRAAFIEAEFS